MPIERTKRGRKRRGKDLEPHERALLMGEPQPGMSIYGPLGLSATSFSRDRLIVIADRIERHLELAPAERRPLVERWIAFWRRDDWGQYTAERSKARDALPDIFAGVYR